MRRVADASDQVLLRNANSLFVAATSLQSDAQDAAIARGVRRLTDLVGTIELGRDRRNLAVALLSLHARGWFAEQPLDPAVAKALTRHVR